VGETVNMAKISPTAASKRWKAGKTTIYKMMNDGELSFTLNEKGKRIIDTSELVRVLGEPERSERFTVESMQQEIKRKDEQLFKTLQSQIDTQAEQLKAQAEQIKVMTGAVERFSMMLEHKPVVIQEDLVSVEAPEHKVVTPPPEPVQQQAKRKKSLFGRLLAAVVED